MTQMLMTVFIIGVVVPLCFCFVFYFLMKQFIKNETRKSLEGLQNREMSEKQKIVIPLRLQAYERLTLFLERMRPDSLALRCYQPGMSIKLLKDVMVKSIRDEFDHNLSQQVYVSSSAWELIRNAKEETITTINNAAMHTHDDLSVTEFAGKIFEDLAQRKYSANIAIEQLKNEVEKELRA